MQPRRTGLISALVAAAIWSAAGHAAERNVRVSRPLDIASLPLLVMQHEHLIERTADAMGLGVVSVTWSTSGENAGEAAPLDALAGGGSDVVAADLAPFLLAADATAGSPQEVRAIGALAERPYVLVTRNPGVSTIRDFGPNDRIAVPALKTSLPVVLLEMAAAQEWGAENYRRLDRLFVAEPDAEAASALFAGKGPVNAHFSRTPIADSELGDPAIRRVMDSFDIAGPHSAAVLATTARFRDSHRELCKAILSALQQADDFIKTSPGAAAEIYAGMVTEPDIPLEDLADLIGDPDARYRAAPAGVGRIAEFMHRHGLLKRAVPGWQAYFRPEARDLPGS
jgi:NitT/TauT family transport system substrate-binding protein